MKTKLIIVSCWVCMALAPLATNAQTRVEPNTSLVATALVATAVAVDGTVFVTRAGGRQVLLARGSSLNVGDAISTTRNSTVRLRFSDGGETVVRPESTLVVQTYQFKKEEPAGDNVLLRLLKGGIRALTGAIGKRGNVDAYQLRVNTATVGIRGTDFSVRLCQRDCSESGETSHRNSATPVAARAVQVRGTAKVSRLSGALMPLLEGQPLYSGDTLQTLTDSHVVLVFADGARITVNPSSRMGIAEFTHGVRPGGSGVGSMIIDMFKGGLRFATGLIGKTFPDKVKVRTATATVGIRGTIFDLVCAPASSADTGTASEFGDMSCDESLFAQTREGTITLTGSDGAPVVLPAGQVGRVSGANTPARTLQAAPAYFQDITTPTPESVPVNLDILFGAQSVPDGGDGVLLTVHEGKVILAQANKDVFLDAGESAFASPSAPPVRLQSTPAVLDRDPFLSKGMFSANMCRR